MHAWHDMAYWTTAYICSLEGTSNVNSGCASKVCVRDHAEARKIDTCGSPRRSRQSHNVTGKKVSK
eukprot:4121202-Amphidinium_carterae.1